MNLIRIKFEFNYSSYTPLFLNFYFRTNPDRISEPLPLELTPTPIFKPLPLELTPTHIFEPLPPRIYPLYTKFQTSTHSRDLDSPQILGGKPNLGGNPPQPRRIWGGGTFPPRRSTFLGNPKWDKIF